MSQVVDLSQPIHPGLVMWPGASGPTFEVLVNVEPDGFYSRRVGLHAFLCEGSLQIRDQELAEASIGLRPGHEAVEAGPGERKLLCGFDPALRGGRKQGQ